MLMHGPLGATEKTKHWQPKPRGPHLLLLKAAYIFKERPLAGFVGPPVSRSGPAVLYMTLSHEFSGGRICRIYVNILVRAGRLSSRIGQAAWLQ